MRLSLFEIETIVKLKDKHFDKNDKIYLFGSRMDDSKKGGDIDLFIDLKNKEQEYYDKKQKFIAELQEHLGEQKLI